MDDEVERTWKEVVMA